jgi:hypothetical protein
MLSGQISWGMIEVDDKGRITDAEKYLESVQDNESKMSESQAFRISEELKELQRNIDVAISAIESDDTVQYCMTGREVQGMKKIDKDGVVTRTRIGEKSADAARFPELTKQMRMVIASAALKKAKDNYYKKYDELNDKMLQDYATLGERISKIQGENSLDAKRELARQSCVGFADMSSLPKSPNPPKSAFGKIAAMVAVVGAAIAVPFTGGLSAVAVGGIFAASSGTVIAGSAAVVAGVGLLGNVGSGKANGADASSKLDLVGSKQLNQWNYKETITTTFDWDKMVCKKCIRSQKCSKTKNPLFGNKYCKTWANAVETCNDTQF